jgi:hypothetical protein
MNGLNVHTQCQRGSQMEHAHIQEVERLIYGLRLHKDCRWFQPGSGFTCKAKDVGLDLYVECLEKNSNECPFSVSYVHSYYCTSPARVYVTKELKR